MDGPRGYLWSEAGERVGCGGKLPGLESLARHMTLDRFLTSLCLSFLICKIEIITSLTSQDCCEDETNSSP